jgi:uncharacterized membrane protein YqjE
MDSATSGVVNQSSELPTRHSSTNDDSGIVVRQTERSKREADLQSRDNRMDEMSTIDLLQETLRDAKELVRIEVELAKEEAKQQIKDTKGAAIAFSAATVLALLGFAMLLTAILLAIGPTPVVALIMTAVLLAAAVVVALVGRAKIPRTPMVRTRARVERDVEELRNHLP